MKKLNIIKLIVTVLLLVFIIGCEAEYTGEDINNETSVSKNEVKRGTYISCASRDLIKVVIEYDFPYVVMQNGQILTIDSESQMVIKTAYRDEMSQHFTICSITESNCDNVETWMVNKSEFIDYGIIDPTYGNGTNNNQSSGTLKTVTDYHGPCL